MLDHNSLSTKIRLIGSGSLGSNLGLILAKMGASDIVLQDFDTVEEHNVANQVFHMKHIGLLKTDVVADWMTQSNPEGRVTVDNSVYQEGTLLKETIIVSGVDTMETRRHILDGAFTGGSKYLIDPRMGGEHGHLYVCDLNDKESRLEYRTTIYKDTKADTSPCAGSSIAYTPIIMAALVAKVIKNLALGQPVSPTHFIALTESPEIITMGEPITPKL